MTICAERSKQVAPAAPALIAKGSPLYVMLGDAVSLIYGYPSTVVPADTVWANMTECSTGESIRSGSNTKSAGSATPWSS